MTDMDSPTPVPQDARTLPTSAKSKDVWKGLAETVDSAGPVPKIGASALEGFKASFEASGKRDLDKEMAEHEAVANAELSKALDSFPNQGDNNRVDLLATGKDAHSASLYDQAIVQSYIGTPQMLAEREAHHASLSDKGDSQPAEAPTVPDDQTIQPFGYR
jgi:hypothetical protein